MNLVKAASVEGTIEVIINGIAKVGYEALNCDRVTIYFVDHVSEEVIYTHTRKATTTTIVHRMTNFLCLMIDPYISTTISNRYGVSYAKM
jgi:hypothetical protein